MFRLVLPAAALAIALLPAGAADTKPTELFNGKDLTGWKPRDEKKSKWQVCAVSWNEQKPNELVGGINNSPDGKGSALATITPGCDIYTTEKFGDGLVEVEFMIPKGSNSGVYLMGEYEVQILDSFGKPNDRLGP